MLEECIPVDTFLFDGTTLANCHEYLKHSSCANISPNPIIIPLINGNIRLMVHLVKNLPIRVKSISYSVICDMSMCMPVSISMSILLYYTNIPV